MKVLIFSVCVLALTMAEPPSNSYLPPPAGRSGGYNSPSGSYGTPSGGSGGLPQVVAARSGGFGQVAGGFGQGAGGFARSKSAQGRFAGGSSYGSPAGRSQYSTAGGYAGGRNALDDRINSEPANYNFDYMVSDDTHGTDFGHHEVRQDERAEGEYHVVLPDGRKQTVSYEADERGFKPRISYEESDLARSGYDNNAQNFGRSSSGYDSNSQFRSNQGNGYQHGRSAGY